MKDAAATDTAREWRADRAARWLLAALQLAAPAADAFDGPAVRFEPGTLAFGEIEVGVASAPLRATLLNAGGSGTLIAFSSDSPALTVEHSDCGDRLAAGARCAVWVTVTPPAAGAVRAALSAVVDGDTVELVVVGHGVVHEFTVSAAAASGRGSIDPPRQVVGHGGNAAFIVTPAAGWEVAAVTGDTCAPANGGGGNWVAESIVAPCAVLAEFRLRAFR